jgi:hypothetical protein
VATAVRAAASALLLAGVAVTALQACRADLSAGALAEAEARQASVERRPGSGSRTRILLDEAHHNLFAAAAGGYRSFVRLVTEEGFSVTTNSAPFSAGRLATTDILLITNPNGGGAAAPIDERVRAAFTGAEVDTVQQWIVAGGALLLVTDHYPAGASARILAERLGVHLSAGWTDDSSHRRTLPTYGPVFGYLLFSRAAGLIGDHPIMNGRERSERIETVSTTTGESIDGPAGSIALLPLSPTALDWLPTGSAPEQPSPDRPRDFNPCPACQTRSASGRNQGIAFEFERGRVVVVGEMGVLTDHAANTSNRQFTLNIVRWLAREL